MEKLFLSGAISGVENYQENFERAEKAVRNFMNNKEVFIFNPALACKGLSNEDALRLCLSTLIQCDTIVSLPNSQNSGGSKIEHLICAYLKLKQLVLNENYIPINC